MAEPSFLTAVRESYDTVAADYVERVPPPAAMDPLSRAMLAGFAELVRTAGLGPVADLGCGPGRVTAHLAGLGVSAFGVDLSPKMIELARHAYPNLRFTEGSMTALEMRDDELGGILAWYSTHHTPPQWLPSVFAEFRRALAPGGYLLWGDHVGDERLQPTRGACLLARNPKGPDGGCSCGEAARVRSSTVTARHSGHGDETVAAPGRCVVTPVRREDDQHHSGDRFRLQH
ncbi:class I SAM-dependent methyltransferase [Streptomyces sp. NPDC026672]|uniref:class I SAM-dependent methyltransferase n=1 Tax=unclassified Streptomyces TaxID=2593676 RepID=UPI0033C4ACC9